MKFLLIRVDDPDCINEGKIMVIIITLIDDN